MTELQIVRLRWKALHTLDKVTSDKQTINSCGEDDCGMQVNSFYEHQVNSKNCTLQLQQTLNIHVYFKIDLQTLIKHNLIEDNVYALPFYNQLTAASHK